MVSGVGPVGPHSCSASCTDWPCLFDVDRAAEDFAREQALLQRLEALQPLASRRAADRLDEGRPYWKDRTRSTRSVSWIAIDKSAILMRSPPVTSISSSRCGGDSEVSRVYGTPAAVALCESLLSLRPVGGAWHLECGGWSWVSSSTSASPRVSEGARGDDRVAHP